MGRRMTCPACGARTSSVLAAFNEGDPCPSCGLPYNAAVAVIEVKARQAADEVTARAVRAELAAAAAENELRLLRWRLAAISQAVTAPPPPWIASVFEPSDAPAILEPDTTADDFLPDSG